MERKIDISNDKSRLDIPLIHQFLSKESTWAKGIPLATVQTSIANSLCFGGYEDGKQIAFARVISDFATFANLVDVFVLPEHRGNGHSKQLMQAIMAHPQLQKMRRFMLATSDAHDLYRCFGFRSPEKPQTIMEIYTPNVYVDF